MRYPHLPPVGSIGAPELVQRRSPNRSSRNGRRARLVFVHRWSGGTFSSVCNWLRDPDSQASSHIVYAGELGADAGKCAQLVPLAEKAWTECELNPIGISIEAEDAIFLGHDPHGFARLARIVALVCRLELDATRYVTAAGIVAGSHGFTRHADGGALGCGHLQCPTDDLELWHQFAERVVLESRAGGFRRTWAS